jgi:hypothetical protein
MTQAAQSHGQEGGLPPPMLDYGWNERGQDPS